MASATGQPRGRRPDRGHDVLVAGTPAEVAAQRLADLRVRRPRAVSQEAVDRHEEAGGAEAALERVVLPERLLNRVERFSAGEPFDRRHLRPVSLSGEEQARADRLAVEHHRARATDAVLAAEMGAGEAEVLPQEVGERPPRFDLALARLAVDGDPDRPLGHAPSARARST